MSASLPPPPQSVSDREALTVDCSLCGRPAGKRCVYMADQYKTGYSYQRGYWRDLIHRKGSLTQKPHNDRRRVVAALRLARWREENPEAASRLDDIKAGRRFSPEVARQLEIAAALREYARRENDKLRDWLREHGHILWEEPRPDGTKRGTSYALAAAMEEIGRAFA